MIHTQNNIYIEPCFSLTSNKLVLYNRVHKHSNWSGKSIFDQENYLKTNLNRKFHGFELSLNAKNNLKNKINWLYHLAKAQKILTYSGNTLFNFKVGFITLTLPSKQKHPTKEITNLVFNQFLTEVRQRTKLKNYVWRLEFQQNGNAHYHIVTDTYIDYQLVRTIWNRCLDKLGYIQEYAKRFKDLSLMQYNNLVNKNRKTDFETIKNRYLKGLKAKWKNPNSVDVKSVTSGKNIAGYISKYFSKKDDSAVNHNILDNEKNSKNLRLWFCSRSLSKLDKIKSAQDEAPFDIYSIIKNAGDLFKIKAEYCTVFYFSLKTILVKEVKMLRKLINDYAKAQGYFDKPIII